MVYCSGSVNEDTDSRCAKLHGLLTLHLCATNHNLHLGIESVDAHHRKIVMDAIQGVHRATCVRFVPRKTELDYLLLRNEPKL